ncbi:hypothetical protein PNA2_0226 [Pyrococcus sp. NA2]|uniref:hypothetical protein n=1 Tax=Pyrococcus sp. (strain NA2) TaxID=342949 RepID=UPI000209AFAF|nr:hypothetical protein [Pyrococcus sp. NA2]AEC51144.1 hypothetical protein PNA2_0226 [Pyrococcus sp. NA2]
MKLLKLVVIVSLAGLVLVTGCISQPERTEVSSKRGILQMEAKIIEKGNNWYLINFTVRNVGNSSVRVALPIYFITLKVKLYEGDRELKYMGPVPTYLPLTESQTKVLKPGESINVAYNVNLCWWNITKGGTYRLAITYVTRNVASKGVDFLRTEITISQNVTAVPCQ